MEKVISVTALPNYRLAVRFSDGLSGIISMENELYGPVFLPLHDERKFAEVFIDDFGAVAWPNGADLAPDAMYDDLKAGKRAETA